MKQLLHDYGGRIAVIEIDGKKQLGIRLSSGRKSFSLTRFSSVRNTPGYEIEGGRAREWLFAGTAEINGCVYFYGAFRAGLPLYTLFDSSLPSAAGGGGRVRIMNTLSTIFSTLPGGALPVFGNSMLIDFQTEKALCFPSAVMRLLVEEMGPEERKTILHHYRSAGTGLEENSVFFLAAAGYFLCTGMRIEESSPESDFQELVKNREVIPPHLKNPRLRLGISTLLLESIYHPASVPLRRFIETFAAAGTIEDSKLQQEEIEERKARFAQLTEQQTKRHNRVRFLRKNGWKILLIVVIGAAGGILGGRILYRASLPPRTAGMPEEQVIRLFYSSYSSLDNETMEACVVQGRASDEIETGLNLYVISRIRQAYEGSSAFIPAEKWIAEGKPPLKGDPLIFGITDFSVSREGENTYLVEYTEYLPGGMVEKLDAPAEPEPSVASVSRVTERVTLSYTDDAWLISNIDEIKRTTD